MEEGEAAPVRLEAPAQVAPPLDRVHRLVLDQLLQHDRRGAPVDALETQEPAVEPRAQQVHEVVVDHPPMRMRLHALEELAAHLHQGGGAAGGHVEAAEDLLPRRLDRLLQPREVGGRRIGLVFGRGASPPPRKAVVPRQRRRVLARGARPSPWQAASASRASAVLVYSPRSASSASHRPTSSRVRRSTALWPPPRSFLRNEAGFTPPPSLRPACARPRRRRRVRGRPGT